MSEAIARYLVTEVQDVCLKVPDSPCCVLQQSSPFPPKFLSYDRGWKCLELHQVWLGNTIAGILEGYGRNGVVTAEAASHDTFDVVVAYLSTNAVDMLLSVLACTSPSLSVKQTFATILPALLNTRWTPQEIVDALQSSQSSERYITIVLYDYEMEGVASQVAHDWRRRGIVNGIDHHFCALPIPTFAMAYLQTVANDDDDLDSSGLSQREQQKPPNQRILSAQDVGSESDAIILFTSGTTGGSNGVRLSHRALLVQAMAKLEYPCCYCEGTAMLASTVPLFHVGGLSSFLAVLLAGGRLVFPQRSELPARNNGGIPTANASTSFQVHDLTTSLRDPFLPANTLVVVPSMLSIFFSERKKDSTIKCGLRPFLGTRLILIGGQSTPANILEEIKRTFPRARVVQTYGCTEAASSLTFLSLVESGKSATSSSGNPCDRPIGDCVGSPPPHVRLLLYRQTESLTKLLSTSSIIRPPQQETIHLAFEVGVIGTSGPHVMNGYWQRGKSRRQQDDSPEGHYDTKSDKNWILTSDLGFWDEQGRLYFSGRVKDVIRTGGETVMAQEVEKVISQHPSVEECAVFAKQDPRYGEAVACAIVFVVGKEGTLGLNGIKKWCHHIGLAGYKQPKFLYAVEALPRNSSGKILKHELVAQFAPHASIHSRL